MSAGKLNLAAYSTAIRLCESLKVDLYTPTMFRIRLSKLEGEKFPPMYEIPFVIGHLENWPAVPYTKREDDHYYHIHTGSLQLRIEKTQRNWSVSSADGTRILYPSNGPVRGLFKDGYSVFDNASAFGEENLNSRYAHWFYSPETGRYCDVYLAEDLIFDEYFIYGPEYEKLFDQVNRLVGPEPLPPKKAFGFWQTQDAGKAGSQERTVALAKRFRDAAIPCDYLALGDEWGGACPVDADEIPEAALDWTEAYRKPYPPATMVRSLKEQHFDVILARQSVPKFPNRADQGSTSVEHKEKVWWNAYQKMTDMDVAGAWQDTRRNDLTDSVIWHEAQKRLGGEGRVLFLGARKMFMMGRDEGSFAIPANEVIGSRRTPCDWTNGCSDTWAELKWQVEAIVNRHGSMKAVTYLTSDGQGRNWKIWVRWMQFLAFNAICRAGHQKPWGHEVDEPDMARTAQSREDLLKKDAALNARFARTALRSMEESPLLPWGAAAEEIIRTYLRFRYRLLPYLYTYAHVNYCTGLPICRPLLLAFPDDTGCNQDQWPGEYMFGEWLLVAPVCADTPRMKIYLPRGRGETWIDYWTQEAYTGGRTILYDTSDISRLPLFVRAGAILPSRKALLWIDPLRPDLVLTLDIYPFEQSAFTLYEDDGTTLHYQEGVCAMTPMVCKRNPDKSLQIEIGPTKGIYSKQASERTYRLQIYRQIKSPQRVECNGVPVPRGDWAHDAATAVLRVRLQGPITGAFNLSIR